LRTADGFGSGTGDPGWRAAGCVTAICAMGGFGFWLWAMGCGLWALGFFGADGLGTGATACATCTCRLRLGARIGNGLREIAVRASPVTHTAVGALVRACRTAPFDCCSESR